MSDPSSHSSWYSPWRYSPQSRSIASAIWVRAISDMSSPSRIRSRYS